MSRDPYGGRGPQRWDADRFTRESDRYEEDRGPRRGYGGPREQSVDEVYERRTSGPRGFEDDRFEARIEPQSRQGRGSFTIEKERERDVYNPGPRRAPRPGLLRRQSSLDTFDRKPFPRYEREEAGPLVRREDFRSTYTRPLPQSRALGPPRRYAERDVEEVRETKISEPEPYRDEFYTRPYPERVREREIIRTRRRSRSRSQESRARSLSSSSTSSEEVVVEKKFPKKGKTRMPARLVSLKAIIELGYPYEKEGDVVVIQKALGPENIDEVIKLSETFKKSERAEMSGGRSEAGTIIEERREEVIREETPRGGFEEVFEKTTFERRGLSPARNHISHGRSRSVGPPVIVDARAPVEIIDRSYAGPLVLLGDRRTKDDRAIRAEIKALELEREALKAEKKAQLELDKADRIRRGDLVVYEERETRKEREPDEGVVIKKDKKGAQARALATMLKTLT